MISLLTDRVESPIGEIILVSDGVTLCACDFADTADRMLTLLGRRFNDFQLVSAIDPLGLSGNVRAYVGGDVGILAKIPIDLVGTPFQCLVWSALRLIPAGETATYAEIAARIGEPAAYRAVGAANARNPIGIVVPCHRLVGSDGSLTGYSGGTWRKRWLLDHEKRHAT